MERLPSLVVACGRDRAADARTVPLLAALESGLGISPSVWTTRSDSCAVELWASSGAMTMTGDADGLPVVPDAPVASRIKSVADALGGLTASLGTHVELDLDWLLAARANEAGWSRRGATSVNGSARMLAAADGWVAINLARVEDREVVAALLQVPVEPGSEWEDLTSWARDRPARAAAASLQEVGVPAAALGECAGTHALRITRRGAASHTQSLFVVDLSALWAGPLAAHLLHRAGARVVSVEDVHRPDGARRGPARFYADLHAGHEQRQIDFRDPDGRQALAALIDQADVLIEASRPRALRELGFTPAEFLGARAGRTWVSITGYGRDRFGGARVAFGDDAAAAGGLVARRADGTPVFCGDAIADPLTGLWSATAAVASQQAGGGHLLDMSMAGVAAEVSARSGGRRYRHRVRHEQGRWIVRHEDEESAPC